MSSTRTTGKALFKGSARALRQDRELLLLPLLGGFCGLFAALPLVAAQTMFNGNSSMQYVLYVATIFIGTFVTTFFSVALAAGAHMRLDGGDPTLKYCFDIASSRVKSILLWALFATAIGVLIRLIESRIKGVGGLIIRAIGDTAFALASSFVVPIIAEHEVKPVAALKYSSEVLRSRWRPMARFSLVSLGYALLFALACVAAFMTCAVAFASSMVVGIVVTALAVVGVMYGILWFSVVSQYAMVVLYRFSTGRATPGFTVDEIASAGKLL